MACRQLTREEYENLPANAKAYEKESDCQCCAEQDLSRCYYCTGSVNWIGGGTPGPCPEGSVSTNGGCQAVLPVPNYNPNAPPWENYNFCGRALDGKFSFPWYHVGENTVPFLGTCCGSDCCPPYHQCLGGKCELA